MLDQLLLPESKEYVLQYKVRRRRNLLLQLGLCVPRCLSQLQVEVYILVIKY